MRLRNAFKNSIFEAPKLVTTKTLLVKHYYRRQGLQADFSFPIITAGRPKHDVINSKNLVLSASFPVFLVNGVGRTWGRRDLSGS